MESVEITAARAEPAWLSSQFQSSSGFPGSSRPRDRSSSGGIHISQPACSATSAVCCMEIGLLS